MSDFFDKRHTIKLFDKKVMPYEEIYKVFRNYVVFRTTLHNDVLFGYCSDLYLYTNSSDDWVSGVKIKLPQYNAEEDFLFKELISIKAISMEELIALRDQEKEL